MKRLALGAALVLSLLAPACVATGADKRSAEPGRCPADDFEEFLQRYADAGNEDLRRRYTADPLNYEVPPHVAGASEDTQGMHAQAVTGDERLRLFRYRFDRHAGGYVAADDIGARRSQALVPVDIGLLPRDARRVVFGAEYEVDLYVFSRSQGCWLLTDVIDPRD